MRLPLLFSFGGSGVGAAFSLLALAYALVNQIIVLFVVPSPPPYPNACIPASNALPAVQFNSSRAVLSRGGKAERLSYDHKAEDAPEQERVERAGGFVLRNRVLGILAVSRSFGNQGMKEFVISEPFISETRWEAFSGRGGGSCWRLGGEMSICLENRASRRSLPSFVEFIFLLLYEFYVPAQLVRGFTSSVNFWTSRGHKRILYSTPGNGPSFSSRIRRVQQSRFSALFMLMDLPRTSPTRPLARSAGQFVRKSPLRGSNLRRRPQ